MKVSLHMIVSSFIYRFYVGSQPKITIVDVNLLKQIMVKEFDTFSTRGFPVKHPHCMGLLLWIE